MEKDIIVTEIANVLKNHFGKFIRDAKIIQDVDSEILRIADALYFAYFEEVDHVSKSTLSERINKVISLCREMDDIFLSTNGDHSWFSIGASEFISHTNLCKIDDVLLFRYQILMIKSISEYMIEREEFDNFAKKRKKLDYIIIKTII